MTNKRNRMITKASVRKNEADGITRLIQENLIQENLKSFESENEKQIQLPKESSDGWTYI